MMNTEELEALGFSEKYNREDLYNYFTSTFSLCDYDEVDGFTFSVVVSGSRGGNCYDGISQAFRNDSSEVVSDIKSEIEYKAKDMLDFISFHYLSITYDENLFKDNLHELAQSKEYDYYNSNTTSEYYQNSYDYQFYFVSVKDILNLTDFSDSLKNVILEVAQEAKKEVEKINYQHSQLVYLLEVRKKITHFSESSTAEKKNMEAQLKRLEKEVEGVKSKLAKLDKTQEKELEKLKLTEKNITALLGEDYIASKTAVGLKKKN